MSKNKQDILSLLIGERAFELAGAKVSSNPEYVAKGLELTATTAHVRKILSADNGKLILRMEEISSSINCMDIEYAYKQGLYDGIQMLKDITSFGEEGVLA